MNSTRTCSFKRDISSKNETAIPFKDVTEFKLEMNYLIVFDRLVRYDQCALTKM